MTTPFRERRDWEDKEGGKGKGGEKRLRRKEKEVVESRREKEILQPGWCSLGWKTHNRPTNGRS